jgi:hypothetical protein
VAIARHTIDLDMKEASPLLLIGIGFLLLALSLGYYFFRRATGEGASGHPGHGG